MPRPAISEYPSHFQDYIKQVEEEEALTALRSQNELLREFLAKIPVEKHDFSYAPEKWTMKELIQHIIDCERIFAFRALAIARGESQSLPGFEENDYANKSLGNEREWHSLCEELALVRLCTIMLFQSFSIETMSTTGIVDGKPLSVNAIAFIITGHLNHHIHIIRDKYLVNC